MNRFQIWSWLSPFTTSEAQAFSEFISEFRAYATALVGKQVVIESDGRFREEHDLRSVSHWHGLTGRVERWTLLGQFLVRFDNGEAQLFFPEEVVRPGEPAWSDWHQTSPTERLNRGVAALPVAGVFCGESPLGFVADPRD